MRGLFRTTLTTLAALAVLTAPCAFSAEAILKSAEPARERAIPEGYYPVTQVRLPERMQRPNNEMDNRSWFANFAAGESDFFAPPPSASKPRTGETWYTNFAAGGNGIFDAWTEGEDVQFEKKPSSWYDNFAAGENDVFSHFAEEHIVSVLPASHSAYASLALPDKYFESDVCENNGTVRIPKSFSFESEDSPVIVTQAASPGSDSRAVARRRSHSILAFWPGRQGTEIIDREPVAPRPQQDTPAMVPPAGGQLRRAEVKLPTSSQGLGMASGYLPGR